MLLARAAAVAAVIAATCLATTAPAAAHTPALKAGCADGRAVLSVELRDYDGRRANRVRVDDGGESIEDRSFRSHFRRAYTGSGDAVRAFTVTVRAWDDPKWSRGWSFHRELTTPVCAAPAAAAPVAATTTTAAVTTVVETTTAALTTTTTPPLTFVWPTARLTASVVPAAADRDLPDTGADVVVPLAVALLVLAGGITVLVVQRRRIRG
ncbi:hypothetical protein JOF41_004077 [Saccharothrix coeruleofusca]|uniref:hypothetical protein n=1 Tax=Saccharothrix coeruleofusca TaxID=33919 RepID=UPI001AE9181D|nr:hypothetical protein [Saccharothrix coeruleofusca]MBP2337899.1 hypothetical protein [Saccharothrix coeruleofusca]